MVGAIVTCAQSLESQFGKEGKTQVTLLVVQARHLDVFRNVVPRALKAAINQMIFLMCVVIGIKPVEPHKHFGLWIGRMNHLVLSGQALAQSLRHEKMPLLICLAKAADAHFIRAEEIPLGGKTFLSCAITPPP